MKNIAAEDQAVASKSDGGEVSTPCGAVSTRRIAVFVHGLLEL